MLVVLSDTHSEEMPQLSDHLTEQITAASLVVHAGDFTTGAVLDGFESKAPEFVGVSGNSDTGTVRERLPETRVFERFDRRFVLVHGHRHDRTWLSLLARQEGADIVIVGHTHSAGVDRIGDVTVVNPGSHADPRESRPTFAVFEQTGDELRGHVRTVDGQGLTAIGV